MLLNPYPYGGEAYRSFTLTVKKVHPFLNDHAALHRDIFEQYESRHFIRPWKGAKRDSGYSASPYDEASDDEGPAEGRRSE
jgi:hypothetical protein